MDKQLVVANIKQPENQLIEPRSSKQLHIQNVHLLLDKIIGEDADDEEEDELDGIDDDSRLFTTYVDHNWSKKILELVGNKAQLMDSFAWLSTVGGGYSSLGERDSRFSYRAGALSIGQQLHLADLLGDDRLKVMCHLFFALASLQLGNKQFCINYCSKVIKPLLAKLPFKDSTIRNMFSHLIFRIHTIEKFKKVYAIKYKEN